MAGLVETSVDEPHVALLRLNRPEARNALSPEMMDEIAAELERLDPDPAVRCIVIAGSEEVFAAGADIKAMAERTPRRRSATRPRPFWKRLAAVKTPMVAAVSGFALGGGCELALACDMIVASETARFGQPEVTLGIIPGGGGSQRLTRVLGKQRAMELVLTGRRFDAEWPASRARQQGDEEGALAEEALELAHTVAERPPIATRLAKQAVLAAEETALSAGMESERRLFEIAMATEDRVEGMHGVPREARAEVRGPVTRRAGRSRRRRDDGRAGSPRSPSVATRPASTTPCPRRWSGRRAGRRARQGAEAGLWSARGGGGRGRAGSSAAASSPTSPAATS